MGKRTRGGLAALTAVLIAVSAAAPAHAALPSDPQAAQSQPLTQIRLGEALDRLAVVPADIPVLVPDTGLDLDHPEIAPRLFGVLGPDLIGDPVAITPAGCGATVYKEVPDADPSDPVGCSGHGTLVAGVLGAAANNGVGSAGVAPNARLIALRSCWDGDNCYAHLQGDAFVFGAQQGARVVSLSWTQGQNQEQLDAIAGSPNTLFVTIAGGNGGAFDVEAGNPGDLPFPCAANLPNVLCVTTSSPSDGLDCGPFGANVVDIAVPTQGIIAPTNGGGTVQGGCATSFASPVAAGVATLLFGIVPSATPADVKDAILSGARPAAAWTGKSVTGGVLDASGAVNAFQAKFGLGPAAPETKKGKGPKKRTTKRKAKFKFSSATPGATFRCSLDDKAYKPCNSPKKLKRVKPGKHTFEAQAVSAGVPDPTPARWKWKVLKG